ncbi:hypothetical protein CF319_g5147 [Tilletia indica]|nr:hypothetical protein CF319_g5147 [Tilletia indica]
MPFSSFSDANVRRDNEEEGGQQQQQEEQGPQQQQQQQQQEPAEEGTSSSLVWRMAVSAVFVGIAAACHDGNGGSEVDQLEREVAVLRQELVLLREGGGQLELQQARPNNRAARLVGRFLIGAVIGAFLAAVETGNGDGDGYRNGNRNGCNGNCQWEPCYHCQNSNTRAADRLRREVGLLREGIEELRVGAQLLLIEAPQQAVQEQEQEQEQQQPEQVHAADHVLAALTSLIAQTGRTHHSRAAINERVAHLDLLLDHNKIKNTLNRDPRFIFDHDLEGWGVVHPAP